MTQSEIDQLYDRLAALIDGTPPAEREKVLLRVLIALADRVDDYAKVVDAIDQSVPPSTGKR